MKKENVVELLYADLCPFWKETLKTIHEVATDLNAKVLIRKVKVSSQAKAKRFKFPGSPTVRINGVDIDPATREVEGYIGCRVYMYEGATYEFPPKEMIKSGFERLLRK